MQRIVQKILGHGNARLMSWDGDRAVTFTMEDALISAEGIMILTGAGLIEAGDGDQVIYQHVTETVDKSWITATDAELSIKIDKLPYLPKDEKDNFAYVMLVKDGEIISEPYIPEHVGETTKDEQDNKKYNSGYDTLTDGTNYDKLNKKYIIKVPAQANYIDSAKGYVLNSNDDFKGKFTGADFDSVIVDYYTPKYSKAKQINITAESFGGNYYVEASTLFRNEAGVDMPAEFIIPNCRVQSNFSFTMASTGDPSSFSFTMDAFPDYTKFDHSTKVLAAIQIIEEGGADKNMIRTMTAHDSEHDKEFNK